MIESFDGPVFVACRGANGQPTNGIDGGATTPGRAVAVTFTGLDPQSGQVVELANYPIPDADADGHGLSVRGCDRYPIDGPDLFAGFTGKITLGRPSPGIPPRGFATEDLRVMAVGLGGFEGGAGHVGTLDLVTGEVVDLTAVHGAGSSSEFSVPTDDGDILLIGDGRVRFSRRELSSQGDSARKTLEMPLDDVSSIMQLVRLPGGGGLLVDVDVDRSEAQDSYEAMGWAEPADLADAPPQDFTTTTGTIMSGVAIPEGYLANPSRTVAIKRCVEGPCALPLRPPSKSAPTDDGDWRSALLQSDGSFADDVGDFGTPLWEWRGRPDDDSAPGPDEGDGASAWPIVRWTDCPDGREVVGWLDDETVVLLLDGGNAVTATVDVDDGTLVCQEELIPRSNRVNDVFLIGHDRTELLFFSSASLGEPAELYAVRPGEGPERRGPAPNGDAAAMIFQGWRVK